MIDVTLVTKDASRDSLTDAAYLGIIDSLRGPLFGWSWQRIADETGYNSKAWWALVAKGERTLDDAAKNALRRITDGELPEQPPSVTDVTQRMVHPDAEMLLVGTLDPGERVRRVLLMASENVAVYANGEVRAEPLETLTAGAMGTEVPASVENATAPHTASVAAKRAPVYRPKFTIEERERFDSLGGLRRIIDAGMAALGVTAETEEK